MADKLKRCPFCGGEAEGFYIVPDGAGVGCHDAYSDDKPKCMVRPFIRRYRGNQEESLKCAIEAWNTRATPWHTGTPTEYGWYLVAYRKRDCDGSFYWDYGTRVWEDYGEYGHWNITSMKYPVIKWQKINELVEED